MPTNLVKTEKMGKTNTSYSEEQINENVCLLIRQLFSCKNCKPFINFNYLGQSQHQFFSNNSVRLRLWLNTSINDASFDIWRLLPYKVAPIGPLRTFAHKFKNFYPQIFSDFKRVPIALVVCMQTLNVLNIMFLASNRLFAIFSAKFCLNWLLH